MKIDRLELMRENLVGYLVLLIVNFVGLLIVLPFSLLLYWFFPMFVLILLN